MIASAVRSTEINPAKLAFLFKKQFEMCKVKPGETVACVSDLATRREYIEAAFAAAESLGGDVYEMCVNSIPSWTKVGVNDRQVQGHAGGHEGRRRRRDLSRAAVHQMAQGSHGDRHPRADDHRRAGRS